MRVVIQRVIEASAAIRGFTLAEIGDGLLVLVGIEDEDDEEDIQWISRKICNLRIFPDGEGVMNLSVKDTLGSILLVSQFTLLASTGKGNRPSYLKASKPAIAAFIFHTLTRQLDTDIGSLGYVQTGVFGADMEIALINDGPVTLIMDSKMRE